jgi:hypothetical protein
MDVRHHVQWHFNLSLAYSTTVVVYIQNETDKAITNASLILKKLVNL